MRARPPTGHLIGGGHPRLGASGGPARSGIVGLAGASDGWSTGRLTGW